MLARRLFQHFADRREQRMPRIEDDPKLNNILYWRDQLVWKHGIEDDRVTAIDLWLAHQPMLPFHTVMEVLERTVTVRALEYENANPARRHAILLQIRAWFRLTQQAVREPYCTAICKQVFEVWRDLLAGPIKKGLN
jgi:hypothetical protein